MPLPATHLQSVQATVKMAPASDLSLRGGRRPTWRPERAARGSALGVQSREGSHDFADSLPVIRLGTARLPRRFAPRNDTSGEREVHQCPPTVELLPTGRSLSAATDAIGRCVFIGTLYELEVPSRDCHVASLLAMTNLGAIAFLTLARTSRRCSTGPGCPLPYKARPEACLLFILHFSVFSIHFFTYAPLQRRVHVSPETKSPPGFPEGIAFYRGMAGTASISCRRFESEMSFRGHTAAQRPQETHLE